MNDSQFDDFVNDKLGAYAAPVPAGVWEKVAEGQFDQFIGSKLRDYIAPVPEGLWEKVAESQFDQFMGSQLKDHTAPVPESLWDKIADGQFDSFVAGKMDAAEAAVPAGLWDRIADGQFDSFVSGKVKDHEAPVPAGLWEKIQPEEDEDDRVAFWWFRYPAAAVLLLALLTAGAIGGYLFFSQKNNSAENTQVVRTVGPAQKTTADPSHAPVEDPAANPTATPGTEPSSTTNNTTGNISPLDASPTTVNNPPAAPPAANRKQQEVVNTGTQNRFAPPALNREITNNPNEIFNNSSNAAVGKNEETSVTANNSDLTIPSYQPGYSEAATVSLAKFGLTSDLSNKQLSAGNRKFKSVIICPADKGRNTDWFLEAYLSPDIALKSVSNVSATPLYMLKKDSSEHQQIGYSAGIRLVKPITDQILLKAGLQYTQTNEKYIYRTENEVKTTTVVTVRTIIRAPGDTVVVNDTSVLQTAGYKTNTVKNRYRSFDVPVTIGYQFGNEDLKFGINAGVVLNLTSWYQGMVLDSTLANVPLTKSGNSIYKTNIGLGLIGSVSIVKRLSDDLHVFAEPYFRYNLSNMSTTQSGFNQRLSIGGLAVGLRLNLNRK